MSPVIPSTIPYFIHKKIVWQNGSKNDAVILWLENNHLKTLNPTINPKTVFKGLKLVPFASFLVDQRHFTLSPSLSEGLRASDWSGHPVIIRQIGGTLTCGELFSTSLNFAKSLKYPSTITSPSSSVRSTLFLIKKLVFFSLLSTQKVLFGGCVFMELCLSHLISLSV